MNKKVRFLTHIHSFVVCQISLFNVEENYGVYSYIQMLAFHYITLVLFWMEPVSISLIQNNPYLGKTTVLNLFLTNEGENIILQSQLQCVF